MNAKVKSNSQISTLDDTSTATEAAAAVDAPVIGGANHDAELSGVMETITIHSSSDELGKDAVFVGHNGFARQIPRDVPCRIPTEVAQGIRDARVTSYRSGPQGVVIEETRPRFACSFAPA